VRRPVATKIPVVPYISVGLLPCSRIRVGIFRALNTTKICVILDCSGKRLAQVEVFIVSRRWSLALVPAPRMSRGATAKMTMTVCFVPGLWQSSGLGPSPRLR
jgi:hypothetical protein